MQTCITKHHAICHYRPTLEILFSLKTMKLLRNVLQTHLGVMSLFSMRTELLASQKSYRSVDSDALCKRALKEYFPNSTCSHCYRPQQSCEGYVFTPVCHSVHGGGASVPQDYPPPEQAPPPRAETATAADGKHPTGMHSCFNMLMDEC